jgi:hypothetical protein
MTQRTRTRRRHLGVALATVLSLVALAFGAGSFSPAQASSPNFTIVNGDFENVQGDGSVPGWTLREDRVDLGGIAPIGGCPSEDPTNYEQLFALSSFPSDITPQMVGQSDSGLWGAYPVLDWDSQQVTLENQRLYYHFPTAQYWFVDENNTVTWNFQQTNTQADFIAAHANWNVESDSVPYLVNMGDSLTAGDRHSWVGPSNFGDGHHGGNGLRLQSKFDSGDLGLSVHSATAVSDPFDATYGQSVSIESNRIVNELNNVGLFDAYLVNTADCSQTQIAHDVAGGDSGVKWNYDSVDVPASGTYRVVIVTGAFAADRSVTTLDVEYRVDNVLLSGARSGMTNNQQTFSLNVATQTSSNCTPGTSTIQARPMHDLEVDSTGFIFSNVGMVNSDQSLGGVDWLFATDSCGSNPAQGTVTASLSTFVDADTNVVAPVSSAIMTRYHSENGFDFSDLWDLSSGNYVLADGDLFTSVETDLTIQFADSTPPGTYTGTVTYTLTLQ